MAAIAWNNIETDADLQKALEESHDRVVLIFKHSTRCSISAFALRNFERAYGYEQESVSPYFLDLIAFRSISNRLADELNVAHQSPQLIVVKNGKAVENTSHERIDAADVKNWI